MDITEEKTANLDNYIIEGMRAFKKEQHTEIAEILCNRQLFKNFINFLKEGWGIKYVEIQNFFDIPRGTMDYLKKID